MFKMCKKGILKICNKYLSIFLLKIIYRLTKLSISNLDSSSNIFSNLWLGKGFINLKCSATLFIIIIFKIPILKFSFRVFHIVAM